jgi:DNA-binding NtrC family response regulator
LERPVVLVVDDDELNRKLLEAILDDGAYEILACGSGEDALRVAEGRLIDVALLDLGLPGISGLELLHELKRRDPGIEVVVVTGRPEVSSAVEALKAGALDYVQKPVEPEEMRHCVARAVERRFLREQVGTLKRRLGESAAQRDLIGSSARMEEVRRTIARVAPSDSPVLIEGESGTGKELVAAAIHRLSKRNSGPFIPVNCSAVPLDLLESEFFGHVRGAFSGAVADTLGLFRSAQGGTLFLDEIGDLPLALQAKLLRALQEKRVRPVGEARTHAIDVRIVAATNKDLEQAMKAGAFRADLFYRLNVVRIAMPPLREHKQDIPALTGFFLRQLNERFGRDVRAVTPEALAALGAYDFPGNVRELENVLERAYAMGAVREISPRDLPMLSAAAEALPAGDVLPPLADVERELILRALRVCGNDRQRAARALGLSPRTLYRRLKEYGLAADDAGRPPAPRRS